MTTITVPASFVAVFKEYCDRAEMNPQEREELRQAVRADYPRVGGFVQECAAVYRFIDATWGGIPTWEQCRTYLERCGLYFFESDLKRTGILQLARECALAHGPIN